MRDRHPGQELEGSGYYHITTQDAYGILYKRVAKNIETKKAERACCCCFSVMLLPCCPLMWFGCVRPKDKEIAALQEIQITLKARASASNPGGHVGTTDRQYYHDDGTWILPAAVMLAAACGGGGFAAGCGGGSACGGGACGGGTAHRCVDSTEFM